MSLTNITHIIIQASMSVTSDTHTHSYLVEGMEAPLSFLLHNHPALFGWKKTIMFIRSKYKTPERKNKTS